MWSATGGDGSVQSPGPTVPDIQHLRHQTHQTSVGPTQEGESGGAWHRLEQKFLFKFLL